MNGCFWRLEKAGQLFLATLRSRGQQQFLTGNVRILLLMVAAQQDEEATTRLLAQILLNTRGPKIERRKLIASVFTSQVLYAALVWAKAATTPSYMSGHGCFRSYLKRYGHDTSDGCPSCGSGIEKNARHVLFECVRFVEDRKQLELIILVRLR